MDTLLLTTSLLVYLFSVTGLVLHTCFFIPLFFFFLKYKQVPIRPHAHFSREDLPFQIVQLPVYNEHVNLVMQLLISATRLAYPKDHLHIQLLDDSDNPHISTRLQAFASQVKAKQPDLSISYLHRDRRRGYKAGNLNNGLEMAKVDVKALKKFPADKIIVSIFDADFLIPADYLKDTVDFFTAPDVGAVQADLKYHNTNTSHLTRAQASFLKNLHRVEFSTRSRAGHITTSRGSAGSWRLSAIEASGGWQSNTQIEDVDMSIAVQLCGWRILYLDHISTWSELPGGYNEFKLQQRSWMKGLMEVFRKRGRSILTSPRLSKGQKILALDFFLILSLQPLFIVLGHLFLIPSYYCLQMYALPRTLGQITLGLFFLLCATHLSFLSTGLGSRSSPPPGYPRHTKKGLGYFLADKFYAVALIPSLFVALTYGLVEGLLGVEVHRGKTNKLDPSRKHHPPRLSAGQRKTLVRISRFESVMAIYSIFLVVWALWEMELIIALVYGILAVWYPWNRILSWMATDHRDE